MLIVIVSAREIWAILSIIGLSAFVELTISRLANVVSDPWQACVCLAALLCSGAFLQFGREACVVIHTRAGGIERLYVEESSPHDQSTAYSCIGCGILLLLLGVFGWAAWVRYAN